MKQGLNIASVTLVAGTLPPQLIDYPRPSYPLAFFPASIFTSLPLFQVLYVYSRLFPHERTPTFFQIISTPIMMSQADIAPKHGYDGGRNMGGQK